MPTYFNFRHLLRPLALALLNLSIMQAAEGVVTPRFAKSGPDAATYGEAQGFPVGDTHTWSQTEYLIGSYSHFDAIFPARGVPHPTSVWDFSRAAKESPLSYQYNGKTNSIDDYLSHLSITGLFVAKDDHLLVERYQYGRTDHDRFTSASMAKTLVAMLLGIASTDTPNFSVDRKAAEFVPDLKGSALGDTTIRDLLHMASGVKVEDGELVHKLYTHRGEGDAALLASFKERIAPGGTEFRYSCGDSETLGLVLRSLTGKSLSAYLGEKLWQPMGAEQDASWAIDTSGEEITCYGFNATLRDWGRVGRLLASDGSWNGREIIPRSWLLDATTIRPADAELQPGKASRRFGYGYQLWILPGSRRMFALIGAEGQFVLADPASKLVIVQTAVDSNPMGAGAKETIALWRALVEQLGN